MQEQVTNSMLKHKLIHPNYHGNVKGKSIQTQVTELVDIMIESINEGNDT